MAQPKSVVPAVPVAPIFAMSAVNWSQVQLPSAGTLTPAFCQAAGS